MDVEQARRDLVEYGVKLDRSGMIIGPGGNISVRCGEVVYIKASGTAMGDGREADYLALDLATGEVIDGGGGGGGGGGDMRPSCECGMHLAAYRAREDAGAFVHSHPAYATAWSFSGRALRALTPDFAAFLGVEVPVLPYTAPGSEELAGSVAAALAKCEAAILGSHGMVAIGASMRDAYTKTLLVEDAAETVLAALAAGVEPKYLDPEEAARIHGWEVEEFRRKMLKG